MRRACKICCALRRVFYPFLSSFRSPARVWLITSLSKQPTRIRSPRPRIPQASSPSTPVRNSFSASKAHSPLRTSPARGRCSGEERHGGRSDRARSDLFSCKEATIGTPRRRFGNAVRFQWFPRLPSSSSKAVVAPFSWLRRRRLGRRGRCLGRDRMLWR